MRTCRDRRVLPPVTPAACSWGGSAQDLEAPELLKTAVCPAWRSFCFSLAFHLSQNSSSLEEFVPASWVRDFAKCSYRKLDCEMWRKFEGQRQGSTSNRFLVESPPGHFSFLLYSRDLNVTHLIPRSRKRKTPVELGHPSIVSMVQCYSSLWLSLYKVSVIWF